ncbi:MAG: hypothetical protein OEU87_01150, partial [Nitrospira sp.]|nr:hypothetical protein [Nitrospira sp.]
MDGWRGANTFLSKELCLGCTSYLNASRFTRYEQRLPLLPAPRHVVDQGAIDIGTAHADQVK